MLICEATKENLSQLYEIELVCFSHPWSEQAMESELNSERSICLMARDGEQITGFCFLSVVADEGEVLQVAVLPPYRNKKIGKQLMETVLQIGKSRGVTSVFLEVRESNLPAIRLYQSLGFCEIARRKGYYHDGETAIMMQRREEDENSGN